MKLTGSIFVINDPTFDTICSISIDWIGGESVLIDDDRVVELVKNYNAYVVDRKPTPVYRLVEFHESFYSPNDFTKDVKDALVFKLENCDHALCSAQFRIDPTIFDMNQIISLFYRSTDEWDLMVKMGGAIEPPDWIEFSWTKIGGNKHMNQEKPCYGTKNLLRSQIAALPYTSVPARVMIPLDEIQLKDVAFSKDHTVVIWENGDKTMVTCKDGDTFDIEKAIAMAFMKRMLSYNLTGETRCVDSLVEKCFNKYIGFNKYICIKASKAKKSIKKREADKKPTEDQKKVSKKTPKKTKSLKDSR